MKNVFKVLGILALVAMIGFSFIACDDESTDDNGNGNENSNGSGSGGTFTLTDIPAEYNGKYVFLVGGGSIDQQSFAGFQSVNMSTATYTLSEIRNESVALPLWTRDDDRNFIRYSPNNNPCPVHIFVHNSQSVGNPTSSAIAQISFNAVSSVTFSNGNATKSWNDGYLYPNE